MAEGLGWYPIYTLRPEVNISVALVISLDTIHALNFLLVNSESKPKSMNTMNLPKPGIYFQFKVIIFLTNMGQNLWFVMETSRLFIMRTLQHEEQWQ